MIGKSSQWFTINDFQNAQVLNLPNDWDLFMTILEGLKQPKVPEYVRAGLNNRVYKVYGSYQGAVLLCLNLYNVYGKVDVVFEYTPITEEEFIQGGLKELEQAGFVVGAQVKAGSEGKVFVGTEVKYLNRTDYPISYASSEEVEKVGFTFAFLTEGFGSIPVGQCTLLPKAQTFPITSQGIPYVNPLGRDKIYLGEVAMELNRGNVRHWLKLGVTSITLPCGTLTQKDLTTLAAL